MSERKRFIRDTHYLTAYPDGTVKIGSMENVKSLGIDPKEIMKHNPSIGKGVAENVKTIEPAKELTAAEVMKLTEVRNAKVAGK